MREFLLITLIVLSSTAMIAQEKEEKLPSTDMANRKDLVATISGATKHTLHEGMPHQYWEAKELAKEKKEKKFVEMRGFGFYADKPTLTAEDAKQLTKLLSAEGSLTKWLGPKKCGGFHPDYAVDFNDGKQTVTALICFGCQEVRLYGAKTDLYCDINLKLKDEIATMLKPYAKNRPEKK